MTQHDPPRSKHPFRDSAILYGVLALVIVVVATVTGGDFGKAILVAIGFFVAATAWSWWRVRSRTEEQRGG